MEIKSAEFTISSSRADMCPKSDIPEYAFIGRSNVGKSSLINMLTKKPKLAMTSSMVSCRSSWIWICLKRQEDDGKDQEPHRILRS